MSSIAIAASVVVGIVFVVAGASKLAAGPRWPANARELGAPAWAAVVVPWAELAVGALLIVGLVRPWPALAAALMLLGFTTLIALRLRDDERPSCACFGQWSASEIGASHLVRNAVLLALTAVAMTA